MKVERIAAAERVLAAHGISGASVELAGQAEEIAAVTVPPAAWDWMLGVESRRVSEQIRALGFRYVALDLAE